ncbi:MAG: molybdenum cofactor guanylyltransferase [Bacteroidales bacterium]
MADTSLYTGIILAGGKSSRLGMEKGLLHYKGATLAQRAINVLEQFCGHILIVTSNSAYQRKGVALIPDLVPDKGPMMGIYSGLHASTTPHNLVLAVDNYLVGPEFFQYLLPRANSHPVAVPFLQGKYFEPLVGYYSRETISLMKDYMDKGLYKLPDFLSVIETEKLLVEIDFPVFYKNYFKSINLPDDLRLLEEI